MIPVQKAFTMADRSGVLDVEIYDENQQENESRSLIEACSVVDKLCKSEGT
jgi:hypothetical protein